MSRFPSKCLVQGHRTRAQLDAAAERVAQLVMKGEIQRFVVSGGCDGRDISRDYCHRVTELLPKDAFILTAGCANYRFIRVGSGRNSR